MAEILAGGPVDGSFAEKIGAMGDLIDIACGVSISAGAGKELSKNINAFINSSGSMISKKDLIKLQNYLSDTKRLSASKVIEGIIENYDRLTGIDSNLKQVSE